MNSKNLKNDIFSFNTTQPICPKKSAMISARPPLSMMHGIIILAFCKQMHFNCFDNNLEINALKLEQNTEKLEEILKEWCKESCE